jgi:hypothetical protein
MVAEFWDELLSCSVDWAHGLLLLSGSRTHRYSKTILSQKYQNKLGALTNI